MVHVRELCFEKGLLVFALLQCASVLFVFFFSGFISASSHDENKQKKRTMCTTIKQTEKEAEATHTPQLFPVYIGKTYQAFFCVSLSRRYLCSLYLILRFMLSFFFHLQMQQTYAEKGEIKTSDESCFFFCLFPVTATSIELERVHHDEYSRTATEK